MIGKVSLASAGFVGACSVALSWMSVTPVAATDCDSTGPDVIIGDLPNVSNYSSFNGIEAFAIGTTSCNIGDEELLWIANSNQHPVIGQNLFRLKEGRFEQIGQAWLKHGFLALTGNVCGCGCIDPQNGARLGVGCSDPYGSGLNGSQNGMGPKYQVNATTGFFVWPPANFSQTGNSIYKRLQAKISDIDPAQDGGGSYFVEGQYVSPDDTAAGNGLNNAAWRPATIAGGGTNWNMSLTGETVREQAAIYAWQNADPTVAIQPVMVDGGLFNLGWRVQNLGGMWEWEFALHNQTSDRSAGGFRIPLPTGAAVSSTGFHDVDYHSGEPFDGTDWAVTEGAGEVRWDTDTFADDPNANALRWGTLYNFRLVTDASPSELTQVEIVLFKPGSPTSIMVDLVPNAPSNDECVNAPPRPFGATPYSTFGATDSLPDDGACAMGGADIWYNLFAPEDGSITIDLCDADFDTYVAVYAATCPADPGAYVGCNDDACGVQSLLTVPVVGGTVYRVRIGGTGGAFGSGTMMASFEAGTPCPQDLDGSGAVDVGDVLEILGAWGDCPGCPADLNGDGIVNVDDLLDVLSVWGPCP